jgi:hypothetical protein
VALLFVDHGNRVLNPQAPSSRVPQGNATVTLNETLTVPESGSTIRVTITLLLDGQTRTALFKQETFTVR